MSTQTEIAESLLSRAKAKLADGTLTPADLNKLAAAGGRLRTFYHSDYFRSAVRHPDVPPFTDDERLLLDLYEELAADPALRLDMSFEPGDVQLISNHTVLHARTAYEDEPAVGAQRHLLRLWLSLS